MTGLPSQSTPTKHCVTMVILQITIQSPHFLFLLNKEETSISELTNEFIYMFNTISANTHSVSYCFPMKFLHSNIWIDK